MTAQTVYSMEDTSEYSIPYLQRCLNQSLNQLKHENSSSSIKDLVSDIQHQSKNVRRLSNLAPSLDVHEILRKLQTKSKMMKLFYKHKQDIQANTIIDWSQTLVFQQVIHNDSKKELIHQEQHLKLEYNKIKYQISLLKLKNLSPLEMQNFFM